jgi:hypothetical protein
MANSWNLNNRVGKIRGEQRSKYTLLQVPRRYDVSVHDMLKCAQVAVRVEDGIEMPPRRQCMNGVGAVSRDWS